VVLYAYMPSVIKKSGYFMNDPRESSACGACRRVVCWTRVLKGMVGGTRWRSDAETCSSVVLCV
jgi:hypothetical protein